MVAHHRAQGQILECPELKVRLVDLQSMPSNMMMLARGKRLHFSGYGDSLPHGDVVPQTPVSVAGDILDAPVESMMSPAKASKHGVNLIGAICNIEHLDIEPDVPLHSDDVDALIQHELNLDEDPYEVEIDVSACLKEL